MKIQRAERQQEASLARDLSKAVEFDQSTLFKKIYEGEFGTPGGEPYGALIGDYYFGSPARRTWSCCATSPALPPAPSRAFVAAAAPTMFGFDSFEELSKPRDLSDRFQSA